MLAFKWYALGLLGFYCLGLAWSIFNPKQVVLVSYLLWATPVFLFILFVGCIAIALVQRFSIPLIVWLPLVFLISAAIGLRIFSLTPMGGRMVHAYEFNSQLRQIEKGDSESFVSLARSSLRGAEIPPFKTAVASCDDTAKQAFILALLQQQQHDTRQLDYVFLRVIYIPLAAQEKSYIETLPAALQEVDSKLQRSATPGA